MNIFSCDVCAIKIEFTKVHQNDVTTVDILNYSNHMLVFLNIIFNPKFKNYNIYNYNYN